MHRRNFLFATALPVLGLGSSAYAQGSWPERAISWVSVSAPGGNSDVISRVIGQKLAERVRHPVVIENKPGASGAIASAFVAKAPPDGYTLLAGSIASHAIYPLLGKVPFDPVKDFAPVTILGTNSNVLVVAANSPFKSLQDVIKAARAAPGTISYASPGVGSTQHMSGELLQKLAGVKLIHAPNSRGSATADIIGGHVSMMFEGPAVLPQVTGDILRPLAVTSLKRLPQLPNVPTMQEAGVKDFGVTSWQALYAPASTPRSVVDRIQQEVAAVLAQPDVVARLAQMGLTPSGMSAADFAEFQRSEIAKWAAVVKDNGIKLE